MTHEQIDIPEPSAEPPVGYYREIPDDSTECSACGEICADKENDEVGRELGTCWRDRCQYDAVRKLKEQLKLAEQALESRRYPMGRA